jgi:hypothetical protein
MHNFVIISYPPALPSFFYLSAKSLSAQDICNFTSITTPTLLLPPTSATATKAVTAVDF